METIAERIIKIADIKCKNMSEFANQLQVTPSYISKLKRMPDSVPSERTIKDICRIFGINEHWLMTGEGEMNIPLDREKEIADIAASMFENNDDSPLMYELIKVITRLDKRGIETLHNIAEEWVKRTNSSN